MNDVVDETYPRDTYPNVNIARAFLAFVAAQSAGVVFLMLSDSVWVFAAAMLFTLASAGFGAAAIRGYIRNQRTGRLLTCERDYLRVGIVILVGLLIFLGADLITMTRHLLASAESNTLKMSILGARFIGFLNVCAGGIMSFKMAR